MNEWQKIERQRRINIIENISKATRLSSASIKKDWWITMVLRALFRCDCAGVMVFKGGTSLSKAWNLIERFSEDIDIAIDRVFFGFEGELKRKQINNLRRAFCSYIKDKLKDEIDTKLKEAGITNYSMFVEETRDSTKDPQIIEVHYQSLFDSNDYVSDKVMVEIGARSLMD